LKASWKISLAVLALVGLGVAAWLTKTPPEPVYQGKTVSEWFGEIHPPTWPNPQNSDPALRALVAMGKDAVPYLMQQYRMRDSVFRAKLNRWGLRWFRFTLGSGEYPSAKARFCLARLGTQAESAVPDLLAMASDPASPNRFESIWLLGEIRARPDRVIPALEVGVRCGDAAVRHLSIQALGSFGATAKSSLPLLKTCLSLDLPDPREIARTRHDASLAIFRIDPTNEEAASLLRDHLIRYWNDGGLFEAIFLADLGPAAKLVFPMLLASWRTNESTLDRPMIAEALKKIDPESAATEGIK
jgi:hypothetical protein